jgi:sugar O-acyltransferase (sialic acid O-acetyltransferase NeuD family)
MVLYGASGHGKVILEILEQNGEKDIEIWDDMPRQDMCGYPVIKPFESTNYKEAKIIISIGNNDIRKKISDRLSGYATFGVAIHCSSKISKRAKIGAGSVIMAGATINVDTQVGKHCIINTNASIDHDCVLGDYVHISPNATLSGNVTVGEGTHIGSGAVSIQGIKIGKWCTIGAGTVIIKDIPDYSTAVGNPARIIKVKQHFG